MMPTVLKIPLSSDGALGGRISKHKQLGSKQQSIDPPPSWGPALPFAKGAISKIGSFNLRVHTHLTSSTRASTDDKAFQKLGPNLEMRKKASSGDDNFLLARNEVDL